MRSTIFSLTVFSYLLLLSTAQNSEKPECKQNGQYCQNHWECCSNSCLSYLYKCVKSYQNQRPNSQTSVLGTATRDDADYNSTFTNLQELISNLFASTESPPPLDVAQQLLLASRFGEESSNVQVSPECSAIGKKCFRDSECCTGRCHGFLHQCVT